MRLEEDSWLSSALGVSSWRVLGLASATPVTGIRSGLLDRANAGPAFFSTKIPTSDVVAVTNAVRAGFSVIDVNVTFEWDAGASITSKIESDSARAVTVMIAEADDAKAIETIATHCFVFSRFHLDPAISPERANEIKRQWAANACCGRASAVYVARVQDEIVGFLAVLVNNSARQTSAIIDLIGVGVQHQGRGAGLAMSRTFVEQWHDRVDRLRVGTQISNIPALRLYESMGFRVADTQYVLHAHTRDGAIAA